MHAQQVCVFRQSGRCGRSEHEIEILCKRESGKFAIYSEYGRNNINQQSTADQNGRTIGVYGFFYRSNTGTTGSNPTGERGYIHMCFFCRGRLGHGSIPRPRNLKIYLCKQASKTGKTEPLECIRMLCHTKEIIIDQLNIF